MIVQCPTCHKDVEWSDKNPYRPFCCERCKLIDLGEWASDAYVIKNHGEDQTGESPTDALTKDFFNRLEEEKPHH